MAATDCKGSWVGALPSLVRELPHLMRVVDLHGDAFVHETPSWHAPIGPTT